MAKFDYKIKEIQFSLKQEKSGIDPDSAKNDLVVNGSSEVRKSSVIANVSFYFRGVSGSEEYGTVVVDIADICSLTIDPSTGLATDFTSEYKTPSYEDDIEPKITESIESYIDSLFLLAKEESVVRRAIQECENLKNLPLIDPDGGFSRSGLDTLRYNSILEV